ncbi:MAG: [FeFe] hydrogenase H-cluster radical SAM maturase HydE [Ignavibacteria bacterium GWB2_35_6b]|nr:MAG: [FeFe] hydrogenase H-cluster radical SAM maturase HydE [Ignavibacteria bacterium GWB2_35_6b]
MELSQIFRNADEGKALKKEELKFLLEIKEKEQLDELFKEAYEIKLKNIGNKVFFRGIIEFSNICIKDCYYCGIRKSNNKVERFLMKEDEILKGAIWAFNNNYGSIVLQSGERNDPAFVDFIENILTKIKKKTEGKLGITISLGEQRKEVYQRWFNAGAHRYLLRIETSNKELYKKLHPENHDFDVRKNCLYELKKIGYQVGTGVMIGLPFQTIDDLVDDIYFFKDNDIDMIGMGPYIVSDNTPLAKQMPEFEQMKEAQYLLSLKMISAARIFLKDVNIAATTALQALKYSGREMGLKAGANIIMPNITDTQFRPSYQLYDNKPCIDENTDDCMGCLEKRIYNINETIGFNEWGDSPHFLNKNKITQ